MLKQLYITNFTLIDTLAIQLNPGFSLTTGETRAGTVSPTSLTRPTNPLS